MSLLDWSTEAGARELARRITIYWMQRGCTPSVKVEPMLAYMAPGARERDRIWCVRSDLSGELPKQQIKR